jgi:hypothetical protein
LSLLFWFYILRFVALLNGLFLLNYLWPCETECKSGVSDIGIGYFSFESCNIVPKLRQLDTVFSPRFSSGWLHMRFVMKIMVLEQGFLRASLVCSCQSSVFLAPYSSVVVPWVVW